MEARKIIGSAVLAAWALILSAGTAAGQYKSKIDVLKGEKWWGVFVTGEQMMPLEKPFPQTDLSTWVKSQATPFLVSSRGRYIWSREPFKIEFTGSGFLIDSPVEQVEAVARRFGRLIWYVVTAIFRRRKVTAFRPKDSLPLLCTI